jgi:drug/metabolite transporter (DMT)-like permease
MGQIAERDEALATAPPQVESLPVQIQKGGQTAAPQGLTVYDLMLFLMVFTWAANPAAIKWALDYMDPLVFNSIRFALATLVPVGILLASRESLKWHRGDGRRILFLGLVGHGIYQTLFILAINNTLAGNVALFLSVNPAFVAIFGALLGYERVRGYAWVGVSLTLAGVALVVLGSGKPFELGPRLLGDALAIVVTLMWAFYTVMSQPLLSRYSSVKLNALAMPMGALFLLVVASPRLVETAPRWPAIPPAAWLILALSGVLAVSASYIIWYKGIQKLGATRTAVYANLVPVLAAVISYVFLNEPLGWAFWAGMALVLLGVSLTRFGGRILRRWGASEGENRESEARSQ